MDRMYCGRKNSNLTLRASDGDSNERDSDDRALDEIRRDCREIEERQLRIRKLRREIAELKDKWKDANLDRTFEDPRKAEEWRRCLQAITEDRSGNSHGDKTPLEALFARLQPRAKEGGGDRSRAPQPIAADEEVRLLREIAEASDRLGNLSDDMLKLYGGSNGIQRLRMKIKGDPQASVKSAEALLLESKTLQLADVWREYKAIQTRFADPAYDRPFHDPELEARRRALLRLLRAPHENRTAYDEVEACVYDRDVPTENDDAQKGSKRYDF